MKSLRKNKSFTLLLVTLFALFLAAATIAQAEESVMVVKGTILSVDPNSGKVAVLDELAVCDAGSLEHADIVEERLSRVEKSQYELAPLGGADVGMHGAAVAIRLPLRAVGFIARGPRLRARGLDDGVSVPGDAHAPGGGTAGGDRFRFAARELLATDLARLEAPRQLRVRSGSADPLPIALLRRPAAQHVLRQGRRSPAGQGCRVRGALLLGRRRSAGHSRRFRRHPLPAVRARRDLGPRRGDHGARHLPAPHH